jgi:hypothetical protein
METIASRMRRPIVSLMERKRLMRMARNPSSFSVIFFGGSFIISGPSPFLGQKEKVFGDVQGSD